MEFKFTRDLSITRSLRKDLAKPYGKVMSTSRFSKSVSKKDTIYAIGDVTVSTLLKLGYLPKIAIFDYRTERKRANFPMIKKMYSKPVKAKNNPGSLSLKLWKAIRKASKAKVNIGIKVTGEEDLASLACIYFARNGDLVVYGLRNKGMAVIEVNTGIKKYVVNVLKKMLDR